MSPYTFIANMNGFSLDVEGAPEILKMVSQMFSLVEEQQGYIETLIAANRKLLDVIDTLKK